jgi:tRNA-dihydrouridine synthase A
MKLLLNIFHYHLCTCILGSLLGHDPETLAKAVEIVCGWEGKYGEINLNCGCPSPRVSQKCFGAKLMLDPEHIRRVVHEMTRRSDRPITVKCRIGVDEKDSYEELKTFITQAHLGGSRKFIIHSRKAILSGLSPKQNRDIPPLKYEVVHRLVEEFPDLTFVLNGGILTMAQAKSHLNGGSWCRTDAVGGDSTSATLVSEGSSDGGGDSCGFDWGNGFRSGLGVHGIMIGRAAYGNPCMLASVDSEFYGVRDPCLTRRGILERYIDYCEFALSEAAPSKVTNHGTRQTVSTMVLLNAMRNVTCGMKHVSKFRMVLNDLYMDGIKGHADHYNPDPRVIIEGAMEVLLPSELDAPLGDSSFDDSSSEKKYNSSNVLEGGGVSSETETDSDKPDDTAIPSSSSSSSPSSTSISSLAQLNSAPTSVFSLNLRTRFADRYYK